MRNLNTMRLAGAVGLCIGLMVTGVAAAGETGTHSGQSATANIGSSVKWHPGHYVALMRAGMKDAATGRANPSYLAEVKKELEATPALRGALIRYTWAELEPAEGRYDLSLIEQHLSELASVHKRLVIMLQTRTFGFSNDGPIAPAYVMDPKNDKTYEGGAFAFTTLSGREGHNLKLWNPHVYDRVVALVAALGARFNGQPYLEAILREETALGQDHALDTVVDGTQVSQYYERLLQVNQEMRRHFPNTVSIQFTNYPRPILASFTERLKAMGAGVGTPDLLPDEPGLNNFPSNPGIYTYYPGLARSIPLAPMVSRPSYEWTQHSKNSHKGARAGHQPTVEELRLFGRDRLKANYIFWTRVRENEQPDGYYPGVLTMLNQPALRSDPAGGLDAACPKAFPSCAE